MENVEGRKKRCLVKYTARKDTTNILAGYKRGVQLRSLELQSENQKEIDYFFFILPKPPKLPLFSSSSKPATNNGPQNLRHFPL